MATLLVDSPPEKQGEHGSAGTPGDPPAGASAPPPPASEHACASCGAPMAAGQDWCLQCGAGAPGSLATPSWRSATAMLAAVAILVLGAGVAAYAALTHSKSKPRVVVATVARIPAPTTTTPVPGSTVPGNLGTVPKVKSSLPLGTFKPPKIPLTAATPKAPATATTPTSATKTGTSGTTTTTTTPASSGATGEAAQPAAILLDTNAASTYNPYNLPASGFGDPSLAIDGDPSTAWTATVDPASAPNMAEGLLIDLKSKQKVAVLKLISSTAGMTVQVYATNAQTAPASITDPAWVTLTHAELAKKKHLRMTLRDSKQAFSFLTLWISRAPKASIGTPEAPGHVDVNEIELFPPS